MNKELAKIIDAANAIVVPSVAEYRQGIADAQAAQEQAQQAKEESKTEKEFDAACDAAIRAREKEGFFRRKLEEVAFTPRMDQAHYDAHLRTANAVVTGAADKFLEVAEKAVAMIVAARKEFDETVEDADHAIEILDQAANVLQCEHRYKITHLQGMPDLKTEDPSEWLNHVTRYGNGVAYNMVTRDKAGRAAYNAADYMIDAKRGGYFGR